jgi:hypothetical protein
MPISLRSRVAFHFLDGFRFSFQTKLAERRGFFPSQPDPLLVFHAGLPGLAAVSDRRIAMENQLCTVTIISSCAVSRCQAKPDQNLRINNSEAISIFDNLNGNVKSIQFPMHTLRALLGLPLLSK